MLDIASAAEEAESSFKRRIIMLIGGVAIISGLLGAMATNWSLRADHERELGSRLTILALAKIVGSSYLSDLHTEEAKLGNQGAIFLPVRTSVLQVEIALAVNNANIAGAERLRTSDSPLFGLPDASSRLMRATRGAMIYADVLSLAKDVNTHLQESETDRARAGRSLLALTVLGMAAALLAFAGVEGPSAGGRLASRFASIGIALCIAIGVSAIFT